MVEIYENGKQIVKSETEHEIIRQKRKIRKCKKKIKKLKSNLINTDTINRIHKVIKNQTNG